MPSPSTSFVLALGLLCCAGPGMLAHADGPRGAGAASGGGAVVPSPDTVTRPRISGAGVSVIGDRSRGISVYNQTGAERHIGEPEVSGKTRVGPGTTLQMIRDGEANLNVYGAHGMRKHHTDPLPRGADSP